ncbi:MAG: hypothetical protein AAFU60_07400 [Bacteroidota bacterium]
MAFPLAKLEVNVPEDVLIAGEALFADGAVQTLQEVERHLWQATIAGEWEIEIQITPSKVKALSCTCETFQQIGICEHTVAGLLALRRRLEEDRLRKEALRKEKQARRAQTTSRLTINTILAEANQDDLMAFIKEYAKTNRNFTLALKARFAGQLNLENEGEQYRLLLDAIILPGKDKNDRLSPRSVQKLVKMIREFSEQVEQAILTRNWREAILILTTLLDRTTSLTRKVRGNPEKLQAAIESAYKLLATVRSQELAPALGEKIWDFGRRELRKSVYGQQVALFASLKRLLIEFSKDTEQRKELLLLLEERLEKAEKGSIYETELLICKWQILEEDGQEETAQQLLVDHLHNGAFLEYAVRLAYEQGHEDRAHHLAQEGLAYVEDPQQRGILQEWLLELAIDKNAQADILPLAEDRFFQTLELRYLDLLLEYGTLEDLKPRKEEMLGRIDQRAYSIRKRDARAEVLFRLGEPAELFQYIEDLQSLDLLSRYDRVLMGLHPKEVKNLYRKLLTQYLKDHFGRKPSQKVRRILDHLLEIGQTEFAHELIDRYRKHYKDRHSLLEELDHFFTPM